MTTTLIVLALYIVIHVLSYLGKEAAKRKEKERQRARQCHSLLLADREIGIWALGHIDQIEH